MIAHQNTNWSIFVLHGPYRAWWPNGALGNLGQYDLGEPVGKWTSWYFDGQLESEQWYENGTLIRERRWDRNGDET